MSIGLDVEGATLRSRGQTLLKGLARVRGLPIIPLLVIACFTVMAILAPLIAPHDPVSGRLLARLTPPVWGGGSWQYPLGTDAVGRDILSRLVYGARTSLAVAVLSMLIGGGIGSLIGMVAGYLGGYVDAVLMRLADITNGFPVVLLALVLAVIYGPSFGTVLIAVCFMLWARFAHVVRADVLSLRDRDYVKLAIVAGASRPRILLRHILPNVANTIVVLASVQIGWVILVEASLGFLGAGVPPPTPDWGTMVSDGRQYIIVGYWVALMPGIAIMLTVLAFNLIGDWLRDALDPRQRSL